MIISITNFTYHITIYIGVYDPLQMIPRLFDYARFVVNRGRVVFNHARSLFNRGRSVTNTLFTAVSDTDLLEGWWMPATAVVVTIMVFSVAAKLLGPFSIIIGLYAGYRAYGKSVPSQGLATGFYFLAFLLVLGLQFNAFALAFLVGFALKRYAYWRHPVEAFRRPIGDKPGYYYNPRKVGVGKRLLISIIVTMVGYRIPVFRRISQRLVKKPLMILAGLEIEPSELDDDDPMYYLHEDSPGRMFGDDDNEPEAENSDLPDVTIEKD